MTFWQEVIFGVVMLILGLAAEFAIDVWRERVVKKRNKYHVIKDEE